MKHTEDAPKRAPMRPHHLGWGADYTERRWCGRDRWYKATRGQNSKRRTKARKGQAY